MVVTEQEVTAAEFERREEGRVKGNISKRVHLMNQLCCKAVGLALCETKCLPKVGLGSFLLETRLVYD